MKLSIIVPVYNEKSTIFQVLKELDSLDLGEVQKEIIAVDDGSEDGTSEILKELKKEFKFKSIRHQKNQGKGKAIISALKYVSGDYVIIQDADLECNLSDIKKLLEVALLNNAKAVYGYRIAQGKKNHISLPYYYGGIFLTFLANLLYGLKLYDLTAGYKLVKSDLIRNLGLESKGFDFCPEITARLAAKKIKIFQVPVRYYPRSRKEGKKLRIKDGLKIGWTLIKYRFILSFGLNCRSGASRLIKLISKSFSSQKRILFFIFLLSLFVSSIFLLFFADIGPVEHRAPGTDFLNCYEPMAQEIFARKDISFKQGVRCAIGYPLILLIPLSLSKITGIDFLILIVFFNIVIIGLSASLIYLISEAIFNKKIGFISALLWLSYPFNQWFIKNPNTEVPFILLLLAGILLYIYSSSLREKKPVLISQFLVGAIFGFNSLVRPIGLLIPLVLSFLTPFFFKNFSLKIRIILSLFLLAGNIIVILPWELYVNSKTDNLVPISQIGPSTILTGFSFAIRPEKENSYKVPPDVAQLMTRIKSQIQEGYQSYKSVFFILGKELLLSPFVFFKLLLIKIFRSWYATSEMWWEKEILIVQLPYLLFGFLGFIYALKFHKEKIKYTLLLLIFILYFWVITTITLSILRYMVPVMTIVVIFAALALDRIIAKLWNLENKKKKNFIIN